MKRKEFTPVQISRLLHGTDESAAYEAGLDCAKRGANMTNCHFKFFSTPAMTAAWERGQKAGNSDRRATNARTLRTNAT